MTHLGVIGGGGWLAGALLRPVLADRLVRPADLVLSSRSGNISGFWLCAAHASKPGSNKQASGSTFTAFRYFTACI